MAIYFNMDEKYLRKGGRKAPQISMEQFLQIMQNLFSKVCEEYDIEMEPDAFQDPTEFNFYDILCEELEEPSLLDKFIKDIKKIDIDFENFDCIEADTGKNGVPYLLIRFGGDWEKPVIGMMYWDGKNIRGYLPTYGNCFNSDKRVRSAFGSESLTYPYKYIVQENGVTKTITLYDEDDQEKINWDEVEAHLPSCKKDFDSRVEGYPLDSEKVLKAIQSPKNKKRSVPSGKVLLAVPIYTHPATDTRECFLFQENGDPVDFRVIQEIAGAADRKNLIEQHYSANYFWSISSTVFAKNMQYGSYSFKLCEPLGPEHTAIIQQYAKFVLNADSPNNIFYHDIGYSSIFAIWHEYLYHVLSESIKKQSLSNGDPLVTVNVLEKELEVRTKALFVTHIFHAIRKTGDAFMFDKKIHQTDDGIIHMSFHDQNDKIQVGCDINPNN